MTGKDGDIHQADHEIPLGRVVLTCLAVLSAAAAVIHFAAAADYFAESFGAYVVTDDPDALFARATAAGAEIIAPLHDTDYGSRDFAAGDPEGNRWSFGTYRGEPRKS
jgi:uncharacterized glyoxalase superfamily protein PhnB